MAAPRTRVLRSLGTAYPGDNFAHDSTEDLNWENTLEARPGDAIKPATGRMLHETHL